MSSATLRPCLVISATAAYHSEAPTTKFYTKPPKTLSLPSCMTAAASLSATSTTTPMDIETTSVAPKKVLIPIAYGTEEMEAVIMVNVLRLAGADVVLASVEPHLEVEASSGTRLVADTSISTCSNQIFDLIAFPGGMPGSARLRDCKTLQEITTKQAEGKRLFGAICAAPAVTLMPWGLLKRKKTTCHPAFMDKLPTFWAVKTNLQVSGELTTSRGPGTCFQFSVSLVEQLFGESFAMEIGKLLLMDTADELRRKDEFNEVEWAVDHNPNVLIPVANGSEEIEVVTIVDILRRGKVDVVVASVEKSSKISGSRGTKIVADKLIKDAAESTYDLIILPGGASGVERLDKSRILKKLLRQQVSDGRKYGAVCSSPSILQRQGLLKDKRATGNPSVLSMLGNNAVVGSRVVIDGTVITCSGLSSTIDFALAIVAKFFGHARARSVAEGLVFKYPRSHESIKATN